MADDTKGTASPQGSTKASETVVAPSGHNKAETPKPMNEPGKTTNATDIPQTELKGQDTKKASAHPFSEKLAQSPVFGNAPNVVTDSKTNFAKQKVQELERQALEAEHLEGQRRVDAIASIRAQIRELREREARTYSGANIRSPRGNLLNAEEAISHRPDFHYRFININAPGKAENAIAMGYERVPESEGGKQLGELVLFRQPLEQRARVVAGQEATTNSRMKRVTEDLRGEVREAAKFLKSRGVDIDENELGIFSEAEAR